jgi:hypothetical protein
MGDLDNREVFQIININVGIILVQDGYLLVLQLLQVEMVQVLYQHLLIIIHQHLEYMQLLPHYQQLLYQVLILLQ